MSGCVEAANTYTGVILGGQIKGGKAVGEAINAVRAEACIYQGLRLHNVSSYWRGGIP